MVGVVDPGAGESCDDENTTEGDGCSPDCLVEFCGNGHLDAGEECDDGNTASGDGCGPTCRAEGCGNGFVDPGEQCDEGAGNSDTLPDACRSDCTLPNCGDGVTDSVEVCDYGHPTGGQFCSYNCQDLCGDGLRGGPELCDGADLGTLTCETYGYYGGTLACTDTCEPDPSGCTGYCGDGIVNGGEFCDGRDQGGESCTSYSRYTDGALGCDSRCRRTFEACGVEWEQAIPWNSGSMNAVWGASANDIFAVGYNGQIMHFNGSAWSPMVSGITESLEGLWGRSGSDLYAVGDFGTILHWDGCTWSPMRSGSLKWLHGVWGSPATGVFAVGEEATILRVQPRSPRLNGGACASPIPLYCSAAFDPYFGSNDLGRIATYSSYGSAVSCTGARATTGKEVFYRLDCPVTGTVTLRLTSGEADLDLVVIAADAGDPEGGCDPTRCVAASHQPGLTVEEVTFQATRDTRYYAVVDGFDGAAGGYTLEIACARE